MHFPAGFEYGVEIQVPSASLHHCQSKTEFLVGCCHDDTALIYSAIFKDVAIIFAINYWNPEFGVYHQPVVNYGRSIERHPVPASGVQTITSVALMLNEHGKFARVSPLIEEWLAPSDTRVEIEIVHGHGVLEYIPESLLRIE